MNGPRVHCIYVEEKRAFQEEEEKVDVGKQESEVQAASFVFLARQAIASVTSSLSSVKI